jgi:glutathione S-transferase
LRALATAFATPPGLAVLEQPQFPDFGQSEGLKVREARWLDDTLAQQPYVAGERFTIADITAFCALEFAAD